MKKTVYIILLLTFISILAASCSEDIKSIEAVKPPVALPEVKVQVQPEAAVEAFKQSFEYYPIDKELETRIEGISWKEGSPVDFEDLRYVKVAYWSFDESSYMGELVVNKAVAKDIVEIFEELYNAKYPIEKIRLIDEYNAEDSKSMEDNNTSAFCFREVEGKPGKLSKHSYGLAIDINPVQNPYVYKDKISPQSGEDYIDRSNSTKGMIIKGDPCYKAFISRGWTWGGDWKFEKDYQHFQKEISK